MRAIRTPHTTATFKLVGGGPENDLPVEQGFNGGEEDEPVLRSTWELTDEERRIIAEGGMIELVIFGVGTPPVAMHVVDKSWNVLLGDGQSVDYRALLKDAASTASHLFDMIDKDTWRATGGDDGQGHYEGDYHAAKVAESIEAWKAVSE